MLMSAVRRVDDAADQSTGEAKTQPAAAPSSAKVYLDPANMKVVDLRAELRKRGELMSGLWTLFIG